jgi:hypothetical protein
MVEYAHGTTTDRSFNMADMQNAETLLLAALFASQGLHSRRAELRRL